MRLALTLIAAVSVLTAPGAWAVDAVEFERDVAPLLVRHCAACHNASDPAGGLDLTDVTKARAGGESQTPALVPGDPAASPLLQRIQAGEMPPEGKGRRPSEAEIKTLESWIRSGANWPAGRKLNPAEFTTDARAGFDWWSLRPPVRPTVPKVSHAERVRTPIDAFVLARLDAEGLTPSPEADRATLIRRTSLDLLGLPPTPAEVTAFVADPAPDAYERLVDRLLASPRYGERWARHWLDIVRFGESNGYETNTPRANAWPYRDWVIAAFNSDLPYPEFIAQQLAGDQLGVDEATGFLVGGSHDIVGSPDIELTLQQRVNDLDDMISTTSTALLGLTVGCAKCHDHKFDPISQRDYYALQAVFAGVQHGERMWRDKDTPERSKQQTEWRARLADVELRASEISARHQPLANLGETSPETRRAAVTATLNVDRFEPVQARFVRFTIVSTSQIEPCIDELEVFTAEGQPRNVALASLGAKASASSVYANGTSAIHQLAYVHDGRFGNSHSWISGESGTGWVTIELAAPTSIDRVVWGRDREGRFRDRVPTGYRIETSLDGATWRMAADSNDRQPYDPAAKQSPPTVGMPAEVVAQLEQLAAQAKQLRAAIDRLNPPQVYSGTFTQPEATHILYRGEPLQKRDTVEPGAIAVVGAPLKLASSDGEAQRRIALAKWIGSSSNPLTARVMVNRIWYYHFGQGLVMTPSDFGFGGGRPSHPELLDWLATQFIADGWHAKSIHRVIMLSSVYRQSSRANEVAMRKDAGNRLLWRFSPRRLEAEAIRDTTLWASGSLDLRMGGPGYDVFEPNTNYVKVYQPKQAFGPAEWRRMVYQNKPRLRQDATFGAFDCPDASQPTARRNVSTTALQALNLLNGPFMIEQSQQLAERLQREAGSKTADQATAGFWLTLGRAPAADELAAAQQLIEREGLIILCRALLNANEFLYLN